MAVAHVRRFEEHRARYAGISGGAGLLLAQPPEPILGAVQAAAAPDPGSQYYLYLTSYVGAPVTGIPKRTARLNSNRPQYGSKTGRITEIARREGALGK